MGSVCFWVVLFSLSFGFIFVDATCENGRVWIDGKSKIAETDNDFICATMDWWPPEKCDYGTCSWGHSSLLNVDLKNKIFRNAIRAFSPLKIRLGGTLQDKVIYQTKNSNEPCNPFIKNTSALFGFSNGCLPLSRWDELNKFFKDTRAVYTFGLNVLMGKMVLANGSAVGTWDSINAETFLRYTVKKNYSVYGWELGNELSGNGIGASISASQYACDTKTLSDMMRRVYNSTKSKPPIIAPGGFFDSTWFMEYLNKTSKTLNVISHHIYSLGSGVDKNLTARILDPSYLDGAGDTFKKLEHTLNKSTTSASAWVSEAGGAYNSGQNNVTNAFVFSFWYLDQLGMSSVYDTKTYCRQTLVGGNYGLLNTTTFEPNPDYYSALLWHRLMGTNVLSTRFRGTKKIRAYSHCAKKSKGITILLMNLDNTTTIEVKLSVNKTWRLHKHRSRSHHQLKTKQTHSESRPTKMRKTRIRTRQEYHLTPKDGNLHSKVMMLNGKVLTVNSAGRIPSLKPFFILVSSKSENGRVWIDGKRKISETDSDFVCATIDWWPPQKCDFGTCSWDHSSLLNVDLNNKIFRNAIKAFSPLKIRAGGTLQDEVTYQTKYSNGPCNPFTQNTSALFGFNKGCLPLSRWDELNRFFQDTRAVVTFGLNELYGKTVLANGSAVGAWDSTNAETLMRYTVQKNYTIYGWELGNELSGSGIEVHVSASQYAVDLATLSHMMNQIYKDIEPKPLIIAPGGFVDKTTADQIWFTQFLNRTRKTLNVISHHIYNLGSGADKNLTARILDPSYLDGATGTYKKLQSILKTSESPASAWVSEGGGAYESGQNNVSNAFVFSFWYLDQLGMSSVYDTKTYCRQTLIGGNYGLLNTTTFEPNPNYYSALLWHRLMGSKVLSTSFMGTKKIRAYSHCAKDSKGITILLINLDNSTSIDVKVTVNSTRPTKTTGARIQIREEYHLTAKDGNLHSKQTVLNGKELRVNSSGDIPPLEPFLSFNFVYSESENGRVWIDGKRKIAETDSDFYKTYKDEWNKNKDTRRISANDGNLNSKVTVLNGEELRINSSSDVPSLEPLYVNSSEIITVAPYSIVFAHIPHLSCMLAKFVHRNHLLGNVEKLERLKNQPSKFLVNFH
ncbi:glycoside hydrolase, family 79 [Artemisia annua]|uniref:Glycoside hydrolase, family 79 n=1 Tax=Artemisia annua TaxID=35608 RepID=A0A2U1MWW8_ARTAN|nr:glycoside hydrolase, family 79 [Artemisia annua]